MLAFQLCEEQNEIYITSTFFFALLIFFLRFQNSQFWHLLLGLPADYDNLGIGILEIFNSLFSPLITSLIF